MAVSNKTEALLERLLANNQQLLQELREEIVTLREKVEVLEPQLDPSEAEMLRPCDRRERYIAPDAIQEQYVDTVEEIE